MSDQHESQDERRRIPEVVPAEVVPAKEYPWTPLERSIRPSCLLTAVVLVVGLLLTHLRLPPLPYSLIVVGGLWLACFVVVYIWQVQRGRARRQ
jgi:hypothetical protein